MKRLIAITLAILMILSMTACKGKKKEAVETEEIANSEPVIVELTVPAELTEGKEQEDLDYDVERGIYTKAELLSDGSVKLTMTEEQQELLLAETATLYQDSIAEMTGEDLFGISKIDKNSSYTEFTIYTVFEEFAVDKDRLAENLIFIGKSYNVYSGNGEVEVKVDFIYEESGEALHSVTK